MRQPGKRGGGGARRRRAPAAGGSERVVGQANGRVSHSLSSRSLGAAQQQPGLARKRGAALSIRRASCGCPAAAATGRVSQFLGSFGLSGVSSAVASRASAPRRDVPQGLRPDAPAKGGLLRRFWLGWLLEPLARLDQMTALVLTWET